ncbi:uncharacterized protein EDB91DRAFT_1225543 [Suillus paluster]|uniref:uncharacterized protein n=1 Tax=Suillus paluster TaxID=48578 RepID=UPI001B87223D|nr:uncharacterized protein EDB91DRAFT_1225543 [Suillus paluster]KAG1734687.1 hypothetical protein EDB91DRAFT_1225543 [Suillus paluster]
MATPAVSTFVDTVILRPIVVAINTFALASLVSYIIAEQLDWRPITIWVTCDIIAVGVDHLKDQEVAIGACGAAVAKRFAPLINIGRIFLALNASMLVIALCQCPPKTTLVTAVFAAPAFLWATPLEPQRIGVMLKNLMRAKHDKQVRGSSPTFSNSLVIKRVPGMKAIFNGIIRGCGVFFVVNSALQVSQVTDRAAPPWMLIETIIWSTVNRTCHSVMTDVRDFDDDKKAGVPTIPVLLGSPLRTRVVLTIIQAAIMMAFRHNLYILASSYFAIALVWILGKDSPKVYFLLSVHSQSMFIFMYAVEKVVLPRLFY